MSQIKINDSIAAMAWRKLFVGHLSDYSNFLNRVLKNEVLMLKKLNIFYLIIVQHFAIDYIYMWNYSTYTICNYRIYCLYNVEPRG